MPASASASVITTVLLFLTLYGFMNHVTTWVNQWLTGPILSYLQIITNAAMQLWQLLCFFITLIYYLLVRHPDTLLSIQIYVTTIQGF